MTATPRQTVEAFLTGFRRKDVDAALTTVSANVSVVAYPLHISDTGNDVIRNILQDIVTSFPDLHLTVKDVLEVGKVVVAEIKIEGTQAADYIGVINQEKHLDIDTAWRFTTEGDQITGIDIYWCQNQLYRRLAVKRQDEATIV